MMRRPPSEGPAGWGGILTRRGLTAADVPRWVRTPLGGLGLAALAALLFGTFLHPRGFAILFGLLTVMGLGWIWPWLGVRGLSGSLGFDRARAREGEPVTVRLTLRNRMPWGVWGLAVTGGFHEPDEATGEERPATGLAFAPGWRTTEVRWEFIPGCRGEYPRQIPRITSGFPFGLWKASRPLTVLTPLVVWPRTFPVGPVPEAAGGREAQGLAARNQPGDWGDVLGVRPYRRGDSLRRIHWPQTARHGQLVICEVQASAAPRVQVVLDLHEGAHAGSGPGGSREWAIRVAASFLEGWTWQGAAMELVVDGRIFTAGGGPASARCAHVLDALARIVPDGFLTLTDLLELPACRGFEGGLRVLVTTDLGMRRLPGRPRRWPSERLVVLKAAAFGVDAPRDEVAPPPVPAWIWIDDPACVPLSVRRGGKEVPLGC